MNVHHGWSTLVGSMVMEGSRTSDAGLDMDGPGLKVENGLGLRSLPDDFVFLEVRAGERGLDKNPTHFCSVSGVLHASRRCSVLNREGLPGAAKTSWVEARPEELRRGPQPAAVLLLLLWACVEVICFVIVRSSRLPELLACSLSSSFPRDTLENRTSRRSYRIRISCSKIGTKNPEVRMSIHTGKNDSSTTGGFRHSWGGVGRKSS